MHRVVVKLPKRSWFVVTPQVAAGGARTAGTGVWLPLREGAAAQHRSDPSFGCFFGSAPRTGCVDGNLQLSLSISSRWGVTAVICSRQVPRSSPGTRMASASQPCGRLLLRAGHLGTAPATCSPQGPRESRIGLLPTPVGLRAWPQPPAVPLRPSWHREGASGCSAQPAPSPR